MRKLENILYSDKHSEMLDVYLPDNAGFKIIVHFHGGGLEKGDKAKTNMAEIAEYTEALIDYKEWFATTECRINNNLDAISHATCAMAIDVNARCIVVNSISGRTARMVSRFRCPADIVGITTNPRAWRQLNLSWGITPVLGEVYNSLDVVFYQALNHARRVMNLKKGDNVVLTGGRTNGEIGNTNTIKVETVMN